jgi:hypothetical protein
MAFSTDNIGKNCYINMSEDENVEDSLYGTIIGYYKDTDKNEEYYFVSINGNVKRIYDDSLVNIIEDGGGGSGAVSSVNGQTGTVVLDAEDVGAEPEKFVVTVTDDGQGGYTADKTFAQISAAYDAGKIIQAVLEATMFPLISIAYGPFGDGSAMFSATSTPGVRATTFTLLCNYDGNNDSWSYYEVESAIAKDYSRQITANVNITPEDNVVYNCTAAALTSLTITNPPATGEYSIVFTSGATPTTTTFPSAILGLEDFAAEANTVYEINVLDNRAVVGSWAVTQ